MRCSNTSESSSVQLQLLIPTLLRYSSTPEFSSAAQPVPSTTSREVFSVSSLWITARSCISCRCSRSTSRSRGVTALSSRAGLPAQISPSLTSEPSGTTAPAATNPPECTIAWRTVAPIDTKEPLCRVEPWRIAFGPTKTLSPTEAPRETCTRSCSTELLPMRMGVVPRRVAPYHTDELLPTETSPRTVALGATKLVLSSAGSFPSQANLRRLGVTRSQLSPSPSRPLPISQRRCPMRRREGPMTCSLRPLSSSQMTTLIQQSYQYASQSISDQ